MVAIVSALLFAEVTLFGAAPRSVGEISMRSLWLMIALALCAVQAVAVPEDRSRWLPVLGAWSALVAVWGVGLPLVNAIPVDYALADLAPILPLPLCLFVAASSGRRMLGVARSICFGAVMLLAFCLLMVAISARLDEAATIAFLSSMPGLLHMEGQQPGIFFVTLWEDGARVYTSTMGLLLVGIHHANVAEQSRRPAQRVTLIAILVMAVVATATRGLLLGIIAYFLCYHFLRRKGFAATYFPTFSMRLLLLAFALSFALLLVLDPAFLQSLGVGRAISDDLRAELVHSLLGRFSESPAWGYGFGYAGAVLRSETAPYSYELSNLALLTKVGIIGILIVAFAWGCYASVFFAEVAAEQTDLAAGLLALCIAIMVATATNPHFSGAQLVCLFIYISIELAHARTRLAAERADIDLYSAPQVGSP